MPSLNNMQKILLYGGTGLVGSRILELLSKHFNFIAPTHQEVELTDSSAISANIKEVNPNQILYAAGFTNVDKAEEEQDLCFAINAQAVRIIVETANPLNIPVHYLSTDYVFNGEKEDIPYNEEDEPDPLSLYAKSKKEGEINTLNFSSKNSVIRLIMPYSAFYQKKLDLARTVLARLKNNQQVFGVVDQNVNPIFVDDSIKAVGELLKRQASGIYHLGAANFTTPFKFINLIAQMFRLDESLITPMKFADFAKTRPAKRPQHSWLDTTKFVKEFGSSILHSVEEGVEMFKRQITNL